MSDVEQEGPVIGEISSQRSRFSLFTYVREYIRGVDLRSILRCHRVTLHELHLVAGVMSLNNYNCKNKKKQKKKRGYCGKISLLGCRFDSCIDFFKTT